MFLYTIPSWLIALLLWLVILGIFEAGHRLGAWHQAATEETIQPQTSAIQGSVLGLLALLLGFTFSMSLQRFDARSAAMLDEANAIGTVQARVSLLPPSAQASARVSLDDYVQLRLNAATIDATTPEQRATVMRKIAAQQTILWDQAAELGRSQPSASLNLYLSALNAMFDAQTARAAIVERTVPPTVIVLMLFTLLSVTAFAGYTGGLSGGRPVFAAILLSTLLVLVIYVIFDLDRPRRGLIQVDQSVMESLVTPAKPQ